MKIYAFIQMYNEATTGHLIRCLENCKQWADKIIIYDDKSTDNSVEIARKYTDHIILGEKNEWVKETYHKQTMIEYIHNMDEKPDWILWLDCDEIVDRNCIYNLKEFCEKNNELHIAEAAKMVKSTKVSSYRHIDAFSFQQINLWRGERYYRTDGVLYGKDPVDQGPGWFVRLWKYNTELRMHTLVGADNRLFPINIKTIKPCEFKIIHYGFSSYKKLMKHIGVQLHTKEQLIEVANGEAYVKLANQGVEWAKGYVIDGKGIPNMFINEEKLKVNRCPDDWYPVENIPADIYTEPKCFPITDLIEYNNICKNEYERRICIYRGKKRIALLLPGNLACFFICLSQYMKFINFNFKNYDVDIYILYSNTINYIHKIDMDIDINIDNSDITIIKKKFSDKIKFLNCKEKIIDYDEFEKKWLTQFNNIQWYDDANKKYYTNIKNDNDKAIKYMDQYIRLLYLFNQSKKYSTENNFTYDYFIRARIDQYIDDSIFEELYMRMDKKDDIIHLNMDNFFIISNEASSFFEYLVLNIGKYENINNDNYSLGKEIQFKLCLDDFTEKNKLNSYHTPIIPALNIYNDLNMYFYKGLTLCLINFMSENSITINNIDEKYSLFNFFKKIPLDTNYKQYEKIYSFIFYSLFKNN